MGVKVRAGIRVGTTPALWERLRLPMPGRTLPTEEEIEREARERQIADDVRETIRADDGRREERAARDGGASSSTARHTTRGARDG